MFIHMVIFKQIILGYFLSQGLRKSLSTSTGGRYDQLVLFPLIISNEPSYLVITFSLEVQEPISIAAASGYIHIAHL